MTDLGRLRWRCRRGMKELDVLLTRYLDERYAASSAAEQQAFEQLLNEPDPLIHAYVLGRVPIPRDLARLIEVITTAGAGAASTGSAGIGTAGIGTGDGPRC